jgi:hypothetical protein
MEYFEVLRHLYVSTEVADVQECLFIPLLRSKFDFSKTLRWQRLLQTFLQHRDLKSGFDAIKRVQTDWADVYTPIGQYADERIISIRGQLHLTLSIPLPPLVIPDKSLSATEVAEALAPTKDFWAIALAVATGGASVVVGEIAKATAQAATRINDAFSHEPSELERYEQFHSDVMPELAISFVDNLQLFAVVNDHETLLPDMDFTLVSNYRAGAQLLVSVRGRVPSSIIRSNVTNLIIRSGKGLPERCRVIINDATFRYRTDKFEHILVNEQKLNDDLGLPTLLMVPPSPGSYFPTFKQVASGDGATLDTPIDSWEQQNPRKEDRRLARDLLYHLNSNLEYYHSAIWWNMDEKRRFNLLDGFVAPNSNGRSVASVVENRLIGIIGNSLIMPVARSFHLDPTYNTDKKDPVDLLKLYAPNTPISPLHIAIPTKGVFAESVMGSCNSCEEKDDTRFWRFEESPCGDEPTPIQPISTDSRRAEPPDLTPQPFPTPMISIQNAPSAPVPTGLADSLKLLGISNLFKDITGLDQNQKNALQSLVSSLETAKSFGDNATKLVEGQQKIALQQAAQKDSGKSLKTIQDAEKDGLINKEDASKLANAYLGNLVGQTEQKDETKLTDNPEVKDLLNSASDSGTSEVSLNRGNEIVNIKKVTDDRNSSDGSFWGKIFDFFSPPSKSNTGIDSNKSKNFPYYEGNKIIWPKNWTHSQELFDMVERETKSWISVGILTSLNTLIPFTKSVGDHVDEIIHITHAATLPHETILILKAGANSLDSHLQGLFYAYSEFMPSNERNYWQKVVDKVHEVAIKLPDG